MITAYIGKMRSGKTYALTQDLLELLDNGEVVYVNYLLDWDPDRNISKTLHVLQKLRVLDIVRYPKENLRVFTSWEDVANTANCTIALDEGWLYFDSYERLSKNKRRRLMQSGKRRMDLRYTVQRPMQADINLRWSTDIFIQCKIVKLPFLKPYFIRRELGLMENNESAMIDYDNPYRITRQWAQQHVMDAYDTLYDVYESDEARAEADYRYEVEMEAREPRIEQVTSYYDDFVNYVRGVRPVVAGHDSFPQDIHKLRKLPRVGDLHYSMDGVIPIIRSKN
jgi:hypothetical protein